MLSSSFRLLTALAPDGLPVASQLVRAGLARAFGPPATSGVATPGDPGLFGPSSASWRVIGDPAAIVGGIRALLVQLLHPLAVAGVADHSSFTSDPLARLHRTSAYVTATTFGSTQQALAAARAVRAVHRRVSGVAPDGRDYRADDPTLLAWVSAALTSSFLATDGLYAVQPIDGRSADAFVAEQSRAAALLDPRVDLAHLADDASLARLREGQLALPMIDDATLPTTVEQLRSRLHRFDDDLEVNAQGRTTLRFLLWPQLSTAVRIGYLPLLAGAVASLTPRQRRLLGVRLGPAAGPLRRQTAVTMGALRVAAGPSPALRAAQRRAGVRDYEAVGDGRDVRAG